jgi:hypothetical protein
MLLVGTVFKLRNNFLPVLTPACYIPIQLVFFYETLKIVGNKIYKLESEEYSPNSEPHTRGIISSMAEQGASSKHSCRASRQFRMATAVFTLGPKTTKYFRM